MRALIKRKWKIRFKSQIEYKFWYLAMFLKLAGVMLLVCFETVITDHNITGFIISKAAPVVYAIGLVIVIYYCYYRAFFEKKDVQK